jgi:endoglucanase
VGWNLGNTLDATGGSGLSSETSWGNIKTTKAMIDTVKKAGFNTVRIPVSWGNHLDSSGKINSAWLDRVQEVVDYVISQDMYCILNVHHDGGSEGWIEASSSCYKSSSSKFASLWKNIATRFKSYGEKLMFESFNEVLDSSDSWTDASKSDAYTAINDFNQLFVDTVRSTGGNNANRNLMVQTYSASSSEKTLNAFVLPTDTVKNHLIVQVHNYDPQAFTTADDQITWTTPTSTWGSSSDKSAFDTLFKRLGAFSDKIGAPVVVGEFAAEYKNNDSDRAEYAAYFVKTAAKYGIKCFWWDTGGMALMDRTSCTVSHPDVVKALVSNVSAKASSSSDTSGTASSASSSKKLSAPVVTAKVSGSKVTLSWKAIDGAAYYRIYKYDTSTKKYVKVKTVKSTTGTVSSLKSGSYKFVVCAVSKSGSKYKNGETSKVVKVTVK